jgi:hypothetical protein
MAHVWPRRENLVYDPVLDQILSCDAYVTSLNPTKAVAYTQEEAAMIAVAHHSSGPWIELDGI